MEDLTTFALAVLAVLVTPGPTNTLLMTSGAIAGFRRSVPLLVGELLGYNVSIAVIGIVLGPVITAAPQFRIGIRIAAAAYLVFVGAKLWRAAPARSVTTISARAVFLTTLTQPQGPYFRACHHSRARAQCAHVFPDLLDHRHPRRKRVGCLRGRGRAPNRNGKAESHLQNRCGIPVGLCRSDPGVAAQLTSLPIPSCCPGL